MIGERIKQLRKAKGYSQYKVADKLNITQGAVSQWEQGKSNPDTAQLIALADLFGVSIDDLLDRPDVPQRPMDEGDFFREKVRRDPEYRLLFHAAKNAKPEHLRAATAMLKALEGKNDN